jgi:hypothetical protein
MSAAILQGAPATTLDTDIWVELPERQFVRLTKIVLALGGTMLAPTVAALSDDSLINFLSRLDGLDSFAVEYRKAKKLRWQGTTVAVVPLQSIIKSKEHVRRPKDLAHLPLLEQTLKMSKARPRKSA